VTTQSVVLANGRPRTAIMPLGRETYIAMPMKLRGHFPAFKDDGEVIASFGQAQLVRYLDGRYELRGGSKEDRLTAKEWISMFCHDVVVTER